MNLLVLGAAISGRAAARLGRRLGHRVTVYDRDVEAAGALGAEGFVVHGGDWKTELLGDVDAVVTSPGIAPAAAPIRDVLEAGVVLWSEMEFASRHLSIPYVAVTGTNGKTTVTATTAEMLRVGGVDAIAAGNIGTALSDVVGTAHDAVVVEASSFQLTFIERFRPLGAAILNVAPDHLDWHGGFEHYAAAKARIFENQRRDDFVVFDSDDPGAVRAVAAAPSRRTALSGRRRPADGNGPEGEWLMVDDRRYPLPTLDAAYLLDVTAAATLAGRLGASAEAVATVLARFMPGSHRRTVVKRHRGVTWIDDSKATNPHAAATSAGSYPSVVLIAGGRNKGLDLSPITEVAGVRAIVAIGEAKSELRALTDASRYHEAESMEEAVKIASEVSRAGDVVLLAPGCASFDMYDDYGARGDDFAALVSEMGR